jgi:hypothetical protein
VLLVCDLRDVPRQHREVGAVDVDLCELGHVELVLNEVRAEPWGQRFCRLLHGQITNDCAHFCASEQVPVAWQLG